VGISTLIAVELSGAVDALMNLVDEESVAGTVGMDPYYVHCVVGIFGFFVLIVLRTFTSHRLRHALGSIVMLVFFLAILAPLVGILAALTGTWTPPDLSRPSVQNLKDNIGSGRVSWDNFRAVLIFSKYIW